MSIDICICSMKTCRNNIRYQTVWHKIDNIITATFFSWMDCIRAYMLYINAIQYIIIAINMHNSNQNKNIPSFLHSTSCSLTINKNSTSANFAELRCSS